MVFLQLRKGVNQDKVRYGNIDTWLLWKLSGGEIFATDYSFASTTGIYDPFQVSANCYLQKY